MSPASTENLEEHAGSSKATRAATRSLVKQKQARNDAIAASRLKSSNVEPSLIPTPVVERKPIRFIMFGLEPVNPHYRFGPGGNSGRRRRRGATSAQWPFFSISPEK